MILDGMVALTAVHALGETPIYVSPHIVSLVREASDDERGTCRSGRTVVGLGGATEAHTILVSEAVELVMNLRWQAMMWEATRGRLLTDEQMGLNFLR